MNSLVLCICFSLSFACARASIPGPTSLQVDKINTTTAVARWNPIPKYLVLGELLGYKVRLWNSHHRVFQTFKITQTSIVLNNLVEDWWKYRLIVQGYTAYEEGYSSHYDLTIGTIPRPSGLQFTIVNLTTVEARWNPISVGKVHGVLLGYNVRLLDFDILNVPLQTHNTSIVITNLQTKKMYRLFVQGYTTNATGMPVEDYFYINSVLSPSDLQVTMKSTTAIVRWSPIPKEKVEGVLLGYTVRLSTYSYFPPYRQTHQTNKTSVVLTIMEGLSYRLCLRGYTATDEGAFTCTYLYTSLTMPSPSYVSVTTVNVTTVVAHWYPIPKQHVKGVLMGYIVRLVKEHSSYQVLQTHKTNKTRIVLIGLQARTYYSVYVQGYTFNETGQARHQRIYISSVLRAPTGLSVTILNGTTAVVRWNPIPKDQIATAEFLGYTVGFSVRYTNYGNQVLKTNKIGIVLTNLKDWIEYEVYVFGYSRYERGPTQYGSFQTSSATIPRPSGLRVTIVNLTTVEARWNPIPKDQVHDVLLEYVVILVGYNNPYVPLQTHKTNKTSIVVTNLQTRKGYHLYVQGYTTNITGLLAVYLYLNIYPVPYISGLNTMINTTTVFVSWNPIPSEHVVGKILGYRVRIYLRSTSGNSLEVSTDKNSIVFNFLLPGTSYHLYVYGYTAKDTGPWYYKGIRTPCGSVIKNKLHGNITMEGISDDSLNCTWTIRGQDRNSMIFIFLKSMNLAVTPECSDNYLAVTERNQLTRLCGTRSSASSSRSFVTLGSSKVELLFSRQRGRYYTFFLSFIVVPYTTEKVPVQGSWNTSNATSLSSTSIQVDWGRFPGPENVNMYIAVCSAQNKHGNISAGYVDGNKVTVAVTNLIKNMKYEVVILAVLKNSLNSKNWNQTFWKSGPVIAKTLEDVPSKSPSGVRAISVGRSSLAVSWKSLVDPNGHIVSYNVYYKRNQDRSFRMVSVEANTTQIYLKGLTQVTEYMIRVAALTRIGEGPKSRVVYVYTGCRYILHESFGKFLSPNYPSNYPSNVNCTWGIVRDKAFDRLFVMFWTFDLEESTPTKCSADFVKVADISGTVLFKGCGRKDRFAIISSRSVNVALQSDNGIEKSGFNVTYMATKRTALKIKIINTTSTEAYLQWNSTSSLADESRTFTIFYKVSEGSNNWSFITAATTHVKISGLRPVTRYEVIVTEKRNTSMLKSDLVSLVTQNLPTSSPTEKTPTTVMATVQTVYRYGTSEGDQVISMPWEYSHRCKKVLFNEDGFLFMTKRHHEVYICRNGVLRFDRPYYLHWPVFIGSTKESCKVEILAPYWSLSDRFYSTVYYHVYVASDNSPRSKKVLDQVTFDVHKLHRGSLSSSFKASWVLVVTWDKLRHATQNIETQNLRNTFQAVLITDGNETFAMYNYPDNKTQWSAPTSRSNWKNFVYTKGLPVVGWSAGCNERLFEFYNVNRSSTVNIGDIDQVEGHSVYINGTRMQSKRHGYQGKWLFQLYMPWRTSNAEKYCKEWFKKQPDPRPFLEYLEPCPCTSRQAWFDERFTPEKSSSRWSWQSELKPCAISTFPSIDGWEQKCCYSHDHPQWGAIVIGHPGGGFAHRYRSKIYTTSGSHQASDVKGYIHCCVHSKLCHLYYQRRPSDDCRRYKPPEWSWMWGDPHFVTLDGKNYTFNGLGEYIMLNARDGFFQLQSRTRLAKGEGTATVLCAAVMKEGNSSSVQLNLERNGNITLLVDGLNANFYGLDNQTKLLNGSVVISRPKENEFKATYPSGISVTLTESKGALSILVALPRSFKNQTKGLLGTWNGDKLDDFTTPSGYIVPANSTSRTIHYDFGQKWQLNESNTLFTYGANENVYTFSNTTFVPMFMDELKFANKTLEAEARAKCGDDNNCLFDASSTNDVSVGLETKVVGSQLTNNSAILKNNPPQFYNSTDAMVVVLAINTTKNLQISAKDPNGDAIRFDVTGLPKGANFTTNGDVASVSWKVTMEKIHLQFIATDSKGASSVLKPLFKLCACRNGASCIDPSNNVQLDDDSQFSIMPCQCSSGFTGKYCEADIDACKVNLNPCYPGVKCRDLSAPANETGYECGPCPSGFTGKGDSCQDIDECSMPNHGCSQVCSNTPGSYVCSCTKGYKLQDDGRSCGDVNECKPVSDCMHQCQNTVGSYRCTCNQYFKVDPKNPKLCIPESPCKDGNHQCQDVCYESNGNATCACNMGYELQKDKHTCADIDECKTKKNRCNQLCENTQGGYNCSCISGFRLSDDSVTCIDINECIEWIFKCPTSQRCVNTIGGYNCRCDQGLYWIDNRCQESNDGEKIPTRPPTSSPRTPSMKDVENSLNVTIKELNISEWNPSMELSFKRSVAREVTISCTRENTCRPSRRRERRSNEYIVFTSDQVHLLPGYPVQVHDTRKDNNNAVVAFYVKFPPDVQNATSGNNPIDGAILAKIINGSLARIGQDIGKILISVTMFRKRTDRTESTTESLPTTVSPDDKADDKKKYIIVWSLVSVVVLVILVVIIAVVVIRYRKRQTYVSKTKIDDDKEQDVNKEVILLSLKQNDKYFSNPAFEDEQK